MNHLCTTLTVFFFSSKHWNEFVNISYACFRWLNFVHVFHHDANKFFYIRFNSEYVISNDAAMRISQQKKNEAFICWIDFQTLNRMKKYIENLYFQFKWSRRICARLHVIQLFRNSTGNNQIITIFMVNVRIECKHFANVSAKNIYTYMPEHQTK